MQGLRRIATLAGMLACVLALLAVAGRAGAGWSAAQAQPVPAAGDGVLPAYRLGAGDRLQVTVYGEDRISGPIAIDPEGAVTVPLAGRIVAEGRTIPELAEAIRAALAAGYLRRPSVAVQVLTFRPWYILGEVNKPGEYPFSKGLTVVDAVAIAEGFTYRARKGAVFITHRGQASEQRTRVTPGLLVAPGDTIRVGERYL